MGRMARVPGTRVYSTYTTKYTDLLQFKIIYYMAS